MADDWLKGLMSKVSLGADDVEERKVFVDVDTVKESCLDGDFYLVGKLLLHKPFNS